MAYVNRGQLYARLAQWDRAAEDFARARSTAPDNAWWRMFDGFAALKSGDEQRYRVDCQQLLTLARDNPKATDYAVRVSGSSIHGFVPLKMFLRYASSCKSD